MTFNIKELRFDGEHGRDEFRRAQIADKVIRLLTSEIDVSPMVIDGAWGTGKTEFTHKLINRLKDQMPEHRAVYIDAFRADHADDPLMTILAEVATLIPEKEVQSFFDKAIPVIRYGIKATLKAGVSHLLRQNADDITGDLEKDLEQAANDAIDASVRTMLKDHERAEQSLTALQILLENIAKDHPIVIFIDELDRCRPDYAVNVLEVIKHTFDVKGVSFVLITNISQLRAAINHQYGAVVDSQRYLDKFLKFRFELPNFVKYGEYSKNFISEDYFNDLIDASNLLSSSHISRKSSGSLNNYCADIVRRNDLSLREINTFVRHLEIYAQLKGRNIFDWHDAFEAISILAIFINCFRPDIAARIYSGVHSGQDIASIFGFRSPIAESDKPTVYLADVIGWYLCSHATTENEYWLSTPSSKHILMKSSFESMLGAFNMDERPGFNDIVKTLDVVRLA